MDLKYKVEDSMGNEEIKRSYISKQLIKIIVIFIYYVSYDSEGQSTLSS